MSFIDAVKSVFKQYVGFSGRARRSEFWYWILFSQIVTLVLGWIGKATGITVIATIWSLAVLLPTLAVAIRRLHDIGKSGWWIFLNLILIVGNIIMIVWNCKDSMPGDNQYGPNPKGVY